MGSKLVVDMIGAASRPISRTIGKGKPLATSIGAMAGLAAGVVGGLCIHIPFVATGIGGAIVGAFAAALIFKRPPPIPEADEAGCEPLRPGAVRTTWQYSMGDIHGMTVLLENALYLIRDDSQPWKQVLQQLGRGEVPDLSGGTLIGLNAVQNLEVTERKSGILEVFYSENRADAAELDEIRECSRKRAIHRTA